MAGWCSSQLRVRVFKYRISRNIDGGFNLAIWRMRKDRHYRSIYITSMGFSPHRTETRQFKIPPTAFSGQTAKYNVCQYFCLYSTSYEQCF